MKDSPINSNKRGFAMGCLIALIPLLIIIVVTCVASYLFFHTVMTNPGVDKSKTVQDTKVESDW